jgi:diadenosine tetraphosphate (Ap4A) HIT family hydrolase
LEASCLACDLASGRRLLPGGLIYRTASWLVEHCVGPLGLGTLIVKPERHVTAVADLSLAEAAELGPLLVLASRVAGQLAPASQVYNCLSSHAGGVPSHLHYVIQPVTPGQMSEHGCYGPSLQVAMFGSGSAPDAGDVATVADRARRLFDPGGPDRDSGQRGALASADWGRASDGG